MSGRIVFLLSSPRVSPGLFSWPAWEVLRAADAVLAGRPDHPQRPPIEAAGVRLEMLGVPGPAASSEGTGPVGGHERLGSRERARRLVERAMGGDTVVWLAGGDGDPELAEALAMDLAGRSESGMTGLPELEVLLASYDLPGAALLSLVAVMDRLRRECPWVREQTHRSLVRYLIEEAYETVEAIESGDRTHLREELGDLLFQVVFHARLAEEDSAEDGTESGQAHAGEGADDPVGQGADDLAGDDARRGTASWSIDDVAADLTAKLIRRNPHVFGRGDDVTGPVGLAGGGAGGFEAVGPAAGHGSGGAELGVAEIEANWDALKAEEKARSSAVEGVPLALPALVLADKLIERTDKAGLDVPLPDVGQAVDRLSTAMPVQYGRPSGRGLEAELGEALLALAGVAHGAGIDAEQALRDAVRRYIDRIRTAESPAPTRK